MGLVTCRLSTFKKHEIQDVSVFLMYVGLAFYDLGFCCTFWDKCLQTKTPRLLLKNYKPICHLESRAQKIAAAGK